MGLKWANLGSSQGQFQQAQNILIESKMCHSSTDSLERAWNMKGIALSLWVRIWGGLHQLVSIVY